MPFVLEERLEKRHVEPRVYAIFLQDRFIGSSLELVVAYSLEEAIEDARERTKKRFVSDGVPQHVVERINLRPDIWMVKTVHELFGDVLVPHIENRSDGTTKKKPANKKKKTK